MNKIVPEERGHKRAVLHTAGDQLRNGEIVWIEAPSNCATGVLVLHANQAFPPAIREDGRVFIHPMGVITECFVENRTLTDCAIDEDGIRGPAFRKDIRFDGCE